jgi:D-alanyl-D-alanine carboxypeptidase
MHSPIAAASTVVLACLLALEGCANETPSSSSSCPPVAATPAAAAISAILEGIKDKYELNAIIFGAEQNDMPLMRTALGVSSNGAPATTDLHFRIGAVGWQYLTTVMLRMAAQSPSQITLSDRVSKWYPAYPNADRTTVRMLAASSAGYGDYITAPTFLAELAANPLRLWTADDLIARSVPPYQHAQFNDPGNDWRYSHTGFVMLGAILEKASGRTYDSLVSEMVIDPLGLRDTRLQFDANPQLPVLETREEGDFRDSTYWNPSFVSWAAMTSNICDLGKFNRAFGAGSLLAPDMKGEVTAPVNVGLGGSTPQGYFGLGTLVYPPWIVQRAAYWGMYTTTAYDMTTGISLAVTIALGPDSPPDIQPSNEIISAVSIVLTPDHPVP